MELESQECVVVYMGVSVPKFANDIYDQNRWPELLISGMVNHPRNRRPHLPPTSIKMKFPSKVTSYKESSLAVFPVVLKNLEKKDMTPSELYKKTKGKISGIQEFLEILDCLYALNKIELEGGVLHYVG